MGRRFALAVVAALASAAPAAAQGRGVVDIAALARFTSFDQTLFLDDAMGYGGRFTVYFATKWTAEISASSTATKGPLDADVTYVPVHVRVNYVESISGKARMGVGLGYVHNQYLGETASDSDDGMTGLFGIEYDLSSMFRLRLDGTVDFMTGNPVGGVSDNWNAGVQLSLSYRLVNRVQ